MQIEPTLARLVRLNFGLSIDLQVAEVPTET